MFNYGVITLLNYEWGMVYKTFAAWFNGKEKCLNDASVWTLCIHTWDVLAVWQVCGTTGSKFKCLVYNLIFGHLGALKQQVISTADISLSKEGATL